MKTSYTAPTKASWEIVILPYQDYGLYEDAPHNEDTRAIYQLAEPIRNWLADHTHKMTIDRGDFGEGDEHFYITVYSENDFENLKALCKSLSKPEPEPTEEQKLAYAEFLKAKKSVANSDEG